MTVQLEERNNATFRSSMVFLIIHSIPLLAFLPGIEVTAFDWTVCAFLYFFRMFWITGGYHRYFSHKAYNTSRVFQFLIAFFAQTSAQKGALWWAAHHRTHHATSDTVKDPHSMKLYGFWYSHLGWILSPDYKQTDYHLIQDYAKFPELRWLNRQHLFPPIFLGLVMFAIGGFVNEVGEASNVFGLNFFFNGAWSSLFIGFFLSTVVLYHGTFSINSIMHKFGNPRYKTGDESKNNLILALITLGEGWHNNHHYYQVAARQGFFWWEIDITFYILKILSWFGIVWDLKGVPDNVRDSVSLEEARKKGPIM